MKNNVKQRMIAILLCFAIIFTSVNLTNFIYNINAETTDENGTTNFYYTGKTEVFTINTSGYYIIECAGGKGGDISIDYFGGKGGYVKSKIYLEKGDVLNINVGSAGANWGTVYEIHYDTYGGGAQGKGKSADGGGSTDIRINGTSVEDRLIVAGGGGAASLGYNGLAGGAATSGNNKNLFYGSAATNSGGGGGGGYYGGTAGANNSRAARGGSNYFNSSYGTLISNTAGYNNNSGYVSITYLANYSVVIKPNGGIINASKDDLYYSKSGSSGSTISTTLNYTGKTQTYNVPEDGLYKLEVYGASGGGNSQAYGSHKGLGGYSSGYIYLKKGTILYVNIGQQGSAAAKTMSWNGGGSVVHANAHSGGGATDISLYGTNGTTSWNTTEHLYSRLIVAGGGGGTDNTSGEANNAHDDGSGGAGGGESGGYGKMNGVIASGSKPGTQNSGYSFGAGESVSLSNDVGAGGGGWYGGYSGVNNNGLNVYCSNCGRYDEYFNSGGGGGSGYVYTESTAKYYPSGCLLTSDYYLSGTSMKQGVREGNGYAVISYTDELILQTPSKNGYTFAGWKVTSGNGTVDNGIFSYAEGETVVEAQWTKNASSSTLTINPNGGIYEDSKENTVISANSGTTKTITTPEREGYRFTGWSKTGGGSFSGNTFTYNTTDATITANWELITASLTIKPNTGLYNGSTNDVYEDNLVSGDIKNITTPTKKGYTFREWLITGIGAYFDEKGFHMGETDIILTAQYDINKYNVKIDPNTGKWNSTSNVSTFTMDWNSTKSIPIPEAPAGMVFSGWSLKGEEAVMTSLTEASTLTMGISDIELVANYETDIFDIEGTVTWVDNNDKLGLRPDEVIIELYQNDTFYDSVKLNKNNTTYSFINLPRCDENLVLYKYEVKEKFTSKVMTWNSSIKQYEEIDSYLISLKGFDFTNTLVDIEEKPIIPVKPNHVNTLNLKLEFTSSIDWKNLEISESDVFSLITLKQLETVINNEAVSYTSNYNGMIYNTILTTKGIIISNIPDGKYEINISTNKFNLESIKLSDSNNMKIIKENGKNYLIIDSTNTNNNGTITFTLNVKDHNGYQASEERNNLYQ